jgi:DNA-binding MarR family transcriptional regulator
MVAVTTTRARLTEAQLGAWRVFLRAHSQITRRLEHELLSEHDLPLASYEVLLHLAEAPAGMLRMTDLADRVLLSRSGAGAPTASGWKKSLALRTSTTVSSVAPASNMRTW